MISDLLLILGCAICTYAMRSSRIPFIHRIGNLAKLGTFFLIGWKLTGSLLVGAVLSGGWLLLPLFEIVLRIRKMEMPTDCTLKSQIAPGSHRFPALDEITEEIEEAGFEQIEDAGCELPEHRHFVRLFVHPEKRIRATINLTEAEEQSIHYVSLSCRQPDGTLWSTWNYPFSLSLKPSPNWKIQCHRDAECFQDIYEAHLEWLEESKVGHLAEIPKDPEQLLKEIDAEYQGQLAHNLRCGVLERISENQVRYSWRGCLFLWSQFLRDLILA